MSKRGIGSACDDQSLTQSRLERVVAACDDFEIAWRDGLKPRIEDYLNSRADLFLRSSLLRALLAVELELRTRFGEFLVLQDYRDRFPDDTSLVRSVFASARISDSSNQTSSETATNEVKDRTLTVLSGQHERLPGGADETTGLESETLPRPLGRFVLVEPVGCGDVWQSLSGEGRSARPRSRHQDSASRM